MNTLFHDRRLLLVLLVSIPMLALAFVKPLGFDNAMYQTMALDLYRYGKVPYIGTWDQNFPGIIYIHYLAILFFGTSDLSIRWFDTIVQLIFAGFLYRFWLRWLRPNTAALTAILYIAFYVSGGGLLLAERDVYAGMVIFVSIWLILRASQARSPFAWFAIAGLVCGLSMVLRPTGIIPIAVVSGCLFFSSDGKWEWSQWSRALIFLLVSFIPLGFVLLYYASIPGGLEAFYFATIRWNLDLYAGVDNAPVMLGLQFVRRALLVPIAIYAIVKRRELATFFSQKTSRWEMLLYISLSLAILATALVMRKYFDYHFSPFYMMLMPLASLGIELFAARFLRPLSHHYAIVLGVYSATFLAYVPKAPLAFGLALTMGQHPMDYVYAAQFPNPYWGAEAEWAVRRYLNSPTNRDGCVEICSFTTNLQLHLAREHVGKYIQLLALAYRLNPDENGPPAYTSYQQTWQRDYIDALRIEHPRFIILARNTSSFYLKDVYNDFLKYIPGFDSLLHSAYRYDTTFGGYQIFRLQSDQIHLK
jgi:hypothetical protein